MPEQMTSQLPVHFDKNNDPVIQALLKPFQGDSLTSLIKEELRCTIQNRRLAQGKEELQVEFKNPPKRKKMTEEERERALKRRQQNREAAQRFRKKQKDTSDYLTAKIKRLESHSHTLLKDLKQLKMERDELKKMLTDHLLVCTNNFCTSHASDIECFLRELSTSSINSQVMPACPDAESSSSVFYSDEPEDIHYCPMDDNSGAHSFFQSIVENTPEVCSEEIVIVDQTDQMLHSCSTIPRSSKCCSVSESERNLHYDLLSAYSHVHMNSTSSEPFEVTFTDDLLLEDILP